MLRFVAFTGHYYVFAYRKDLEEIANQIAKLFLFISKFSANCCEFHGSEKLSFVKNRKFIINGWTQNKLLFSQLRDKSDPVSENSLT
jgi:hypothetical protein